MAVFWGAKDINNNIILYIFPHIAIYFQAYVYTYVLNTWKAIRHETHEQNIGERVVLTKRENKRAYLMPREIENLMMMIAMIMAMMMTTMIVMRMMGMRVRVKRSLMNCGPSHQEHPTE